MLRVRTSARRGPWLDLLGPDLARVLRAHPLAAHLDAIALLGTGDPFLVRPEDPAAKVIVPLLGGERADAMTRRQIAAMSAVVLVDAAEAPGEIGAAVPVLVETSARTGQGFLRPASAFDQMQAEVALAALPDVRGCIAQVRPGATDPPVTPEHIANAVVEAAIAVGGFRD